MSEDVRRAGRPADSDDLNAKIGVLTRREVEARLLAPVVEALAHEFGYARVVEVLRATIVQIAHQQGDALAAAMGGDSLVHFAESLQYWTRDQALELEVLHQDEERFDFNVTRCRYAEMYRALGISDLGAVLSCNRDYALIGGFNRNVELNRTQTIMEGATCCDFRYRVRQAPAGDDARGKGAAVGQPPHDDGEKCGE
jgi:hypothetical protein